MTDIVSAIYDLMGKVSEPCVDEDTIKEKVDRIFQVRFFKMVYTKYQNYVAQAWV